MLDLIPHEFQLRHEFDSITEGSLLAGLFFSCIEGWFWLGANVRCVGISVHGLDEGLDISPFRLCPTQALLRIPRIPLVSFSLKFFCREKGTCCGLLHDAVDIPLHCLLIEAIET